MVRARSRNFAVDDSGQATTEYIILLSAAIVAATALMKKFLTVLDRGILNLGGQLEKDLKTGRTDIRAWKN